jgi:hypothetical protein
VSWVHVKKISYPKNVWNLEKTAFCTKEYAEIHIKKSFFDIEKGIWKIPRLKIQMVGSCFGAPSTHGSFVFERISKFLELIVSR